MKKYLILGGAFLLPFLVNPWAAFQDAQLYPPKLFGLFLVSSIAFGFILSKRIHPCLGLLHVLISFGIFLTGFGPVQIYPYLYLVSSLFFSLWLIESENVDSFFNTMAWAGIPICALGILQWLHMDPIFRYAEGIQQDPTGFFGQITKFGSYTAILGSVCFARGWWKRFLVLAFCTIISGSSCAIGSLFIGCMITLRKYFGTGIIKKPFMILAPIVVFGIIYLPHVPVFSSHLRLKIWEATWNAFLKSPIFGYGMGSFYAIFESQFQPENTMSGGAFGHAHNDYLQVLFEGGIFVGIGVFFVLFMVFVYFYRFWWRTCTDRPDLVCAEAAGAAILSNALANFPFQLTPHNLMGILAICVLLKETQGIKLGSGGSKSQPIVYTLFQRLQTRFACHWVRLTTSRKQKQRS